MSAPTAIGTPLRVEHLPVEEVQMHIEAAETLII
jgi:hypothetical protein